MFQKEKKHNFSREDFWLKNGYEQQHENFHVSTHDKF